jgi:hypothetical protein
MNTFEISLVVALAVLLAFLAGSLLVFFNYAKIVKQVQRTVAQFTPVVQKAEADVKAVETVASTVVADFTKL